MSGWILAEEHEAYEVVVGGQGEGPLLLTCEHGGAELPAPWAWPEADRRLVGTHWSTDLGAADFTREFAADLGVAGVISRFTRLLIDPNRELESPTLFRSEAEGAPIWLNAHISSEEREERIRRFYRPYHQAVAHWTRTTPKAPILSIHSFTPLYEGQPRTVEVGVLFDIHERAAERMAAVFAAAGFQTALNEPWSGKAGLMYSAATHAEANGRPAIEMEFRQDLLTDPAWRARARATMREALVAAGWWPAA